MNYEDRITKEYVEGLLAAMPKVATGSYVGTGTYGEENPTRLTFPFTPKLAFICSDAEPVSTRLLIWYTGARSVQQCGSSSSMPCSLSGNTLSWHTSMGAHEQYNSSGAVYYWFAIG